VLVSHNRRDRARFRSLVGARRRSGNDSLCVLLLPRDAYDVRLRLRTMLLLDRYAALPLPKPETLIWNDAAQALIHGPPPPGYSVSEIRLALGHRPISPGT
jgi:hypothetical protein